MLDSIFWEARYLGLARIGHEILAMFVSLGCPHWGKSPKDSDGSVNVMTLWISFEDFRAGLQSVCSFESLHLNEMQDFVLISAT